MDSRFLMTLQVAVVGAQKIGAVPHGTRVTAGELVQLLRREISGT